MVDLPNGLGVILSGMPVRQRGKKEGRQVREDERAGQQGTGLLRRG